MLLLGNFGQQINTIEIMKSKLFLLFVVVILFVNSSFAQNDDITGLGMSFGGGGGIGKYHLDNVVYTNAPIMLGYFNMIWVPKKAKAIHWNFFLLEF